MISLQGLVDYFSKQCNIINKHVYEVEIMEEEQNQSPLVYLQDKLRKTVTKLNKKINQRDNLMKRMNRVENEVNELENKVNVLKSLINEDYKDLNIQTEPDSQKQRKFIRQDKEYDKSKTLAEHIYDILQEYPDGLRLKEIVEIIINQNKINPNTKHPDASLSTAMRRREDWFENENGVWKIKSTEKEETEEKEQTYKRTKPSASKEEFSLDDEEIDEDIPF